MKKKSIILALILLILASPLYAAGQQFNRRKPVIIDQDLIIRTADISEYALFYPVTIDGFSIEILVVRAPDNTIRTAFNACIVCYSLGKGYFVQHRSVLICQQCGESFTMDSVEVQSEGCYPIPISRENKTVTAAAITISREYLLQAKIMFEQLME